ncbi:cell wall-binding repeat-containing protein [Ornithinimicrobium sp. Y1847]|uniref:cell wall-binding repeat-containing protein n=1 Tax=Ornithinimicrobium sp. Y1847 TaxID=3405419 RepID=UPI003B68052A
MAIGLPSWATPDLSVAEDGSYIVMLKQDSLATYTGGIQGFAPTAPKDGQRLNVETRAATAYADFLRAEQDKALTAAGASTEAKTYDYTTVFNGFSADLTAGQVMALRKDPNVAYVWEDETRYADTVTTPDFLGMTGADGVWNTRFGGTEDAGAGVVVGVIDTGIWPENPSFAPLDAPVPASFVGECDSGEEEDPADNVECNSKIVGARYYAQNNNTDFDFLSPRDTNSHGSHVGGTAAGNYGVDVEIFGTEMGMASGMAPAAHIAVYKGLWQTEGGGGSGSTSGLLAAVNDAVADGVDVINYSVSGSSEYVVDSIELAFLDAADAGVFVSASAGNSGDTVGTSSVAHNSPWVMTVGASTHDRNVSKYVELDATAGQDIVDRISGRDRYATAAAVARQYPEGVDTVYIATGNQFADALAGAASAAKGLVPSMGAASSRDPQTTVAPDGSPAPVLLTRVDSLPSVTAAAIEELAPSNIIILGGTVAVSDAVEAELAAYGDVTRISGKDRYATAAQLAQHFGPVEHVYLAAGEGTAFPDALASSALAGSEGVPVLLTRQGSLPGSVAAALDAMGNPEVHVIGGSGAISDAVYEAAGASERIAGKDRYATSAAVADRFGYDSENPAPAAFVATGLDYPDALAGSALAAMHNVPVVLSRTASVPGSVMNALISMDPQWIHILGGEGALNASVETQLEDQFNTAGTGDGQRFEGVGVGEAVGPAPLVDSETIPAEGATVAQARLCYPGSLDPAAAEGHIVFCTRGEIARVDKSAAVAQAGGIGMIQANTSNSESLNADFHTIPSIHVNATAGEAIKAYIASDDNPTGYISAQGEGSDDVVAPEMAGFSSYGPALAGGGDLLKPDITAPGVDIIAAVSPESNDGENFNGMSGTSMSAPHVAGLAALMMSEGETWYREPMAVKSAMMTTANPLNSAGETITYGGAPASPLHFGSGHVVPGAAYDTPLFYDSDIVDWYTYACAIGQLQLVGGGAFCEAAPDTDASDLNYPSIAIGALAGEQTVTRTVTATGAGGTFEASVEAPAGVNVTVSPSTITVPAGGSATFEVHIEADGAALGQWAFGAITWSGPGADVRSPIAVNPVALSAPSELGGTGPAGSTTFEVVPGGDATLTSTVSGLVAADQSEITVVSDGNPSSIADKIIPIEVPAGTAAIRVELWEDDWTPEGLDLDLYLATPAGSVVAQSGNEGSDEVVTFEAPQAGTWLVAINYWDGAAGAQADGLLHVYLPNEDEGNLTVTPNPATVQSGEPTDLTATWSGLDAALRYFGVIGYDMGDGEVATTLVTIVPPAE